VIARTSSFSFKGKDADVATIAEALKVAHLLEGSVRRSGNKLRISAKLIRTADGGELWSQAYDREMADIFAMQDEIATAVTSELKLKLLGEARPVAHANPEAYALLLQARQLRSLRTSASLTQSLALLQQALQLDPGMPDAWTELSLTYRGQSDVGMRPNAEGYRLAREAAEKALSLDPDHANAHVQLSALARGDLDLAGAAKHLERAAASSPGGVLVWRAASRLMEMLGRKEEAIAFALACVPLDPQNANTYTVLASAYQTAGRWQESQAAYQKAIQLSPNYVTAHDAMSDNLLQMGKPQEALAEAKLEEAGLWRSVALAKAYYALGRKAEADAALAEAIRDYPRDGPYNIAYVYAIRGENDLAFEWLERAVQESDPGLTEIAVSMYFVKLHDDPRWLPFLRRVGFAPEQLAAIKLDVPLPTASD
jgi:tetratricopeptide (TPR) repeat protein